MTITPESSSSFSSSSTSPPSSSPLNTSASNDNTSSASFAQWRKKISHLTGVGLSSEERERWIQGRQHQRCEQLKTDLITKSPILRFLTDHLEVQGCPFQLKHFYCQPCDASRTGGFSPDHGVVLCENRLGSKNVTEDTLAHELIHALDHCRMQLNWSNCHHHACTEIRAASLSGDCRFANEWKRGHLKVLKQHQRCVKRRALLSLMENPNCASKEVAEEAIHDVWSSCFADTWPFDEIFK